MSTNRASGAVEDPRRLAALRRLGLPDPRVRESFDRLSRLAARVLRAPVGLVTLVEEDHQLFLGSYGLPEPFASMERVPPSYSYCRQVVEDGAPLVVEDAREHPRLREHAALLELGVVAYLGIPLSTREGLLLGAFVVIDGQPRSWSDEEVSLLQDLAASVMAEIEARREGEQRARAEARSTRILESITDAFVALDGEWRFVYLNGAAEAVLGRTGGELVGANVWDAFPEAVGSTFEREYRRAVEGGVPVVFEEYFAPLQAWLSVHAYPSEEGLAVYFHDVTKRKRADGERIRREQEFQALAEHNPDVVARLDRRHRFLYVNRAVERAAGRAAADFVGRSIGELGVPRALRQEWEAELERCFETAAPQELALELPTPHGTRSFHARLVPEPAPDGTVATVLCICREVTEQARAEQALRRREEYYRALIENSLDLILVLNPDGTTRYASPSAQRILGYTPEELQALAEPVLIHPDDVPVLLAALEQAVRAPGAPQPVRCRVRHRDGSWRVLSGSGTPMPGAAAASGVVINARDVTEEQQWLEEIQRRDAILEAAGFAAEQFLRSCGWEESVPAILERLGRATRSGRAYIFERRVDDAGEGRLYQRFEWAAEGVEPEIDNPALQGFSLASLGLERWEAELAGDKPIYVNVEELPEAARPHFAEQGIRSLVAAPIFVGGEWWGVLGLDDCAAERNWSGAEREALRVATDTLGGAVQRQRAEAALRESEERFRLMVEGSEQVFFYEHDVEGRFTYLSPSVEAVLGHAPDELIGRPFWSLLTGDASDEEVRRRTDAALGTGQGQAAYLVFNRHRDGRAIPMEVVETPVLRGGRVVGIQGFARDVSERRRADERLARAEAHYRRLVETSPYGIFALDREGRFTEVNPALAELLGQSTSELLGRPFYEVIAAKDLARLQTTFQERMAQRLTGLKTYECHLVRNTGEERLGEIRTVSMIEDGEVIGSHGVVRDITAQRATEASLQESELRFRALVENIHEVISILDADGTVRYVSPAFERITGLAPERRRGRSAFDRVHPDDVEMARTSFQRLRDEPASSVRIEPRIQHQDGSWRVVELVGQNLLHDPAVQGIVVTYRDITEQRRLEEQLRQAQRLEAVGQLAGGVAHDFNNLLMVIDANSRFVLEDLPADSPSREDLEEVRSAAEKAAGLTQQLLAFSRKQVMQPQLLHLNEVVSATQKMLRRLIGEDVELEVALDPHLGLVQADPVQMDQVVINLAVNARDAMPTGGRLRLATRNVTLTAEDAARHPHKVLAGEYVVLSVVDTGHGMDPETLGRVFEPFFTTKEQGKGTGLGLSTVYGIVRQSGGYIWAESRVGAGTSFHVYLPRVDVGGRKVQTVSGAAPAGAGQTILVVEDEAAVRTLARRVLERAGYRVLQAGDGEEALAVAERHGGDIHLLLTDVVMPRMSGRVLAERLGALRPGLPVLFMSGYTDDAVLRHGVEQASVHILQKPVTPDQLLARVSLLLAGRPSSGTAS